MAFFLAIALSLPRKRLSPSGRRGHDLAAETFRSGKTARKQPDAGAFDIALAAGDLAGKAQARTRLQRQRAVEQDGRVDIGVAVQAAEAREFGILQTSASTKALYCASSIGQLI